MKELMLCQLLRVDVEAIPEKIEFSTTCRIRNIIFDPLNDEYILLFVEDDIDEGTAVISKDLLQNESEWASFIGKTVQLKGFAMPSIRAKDAIKLFSYSIKEV